MARSRKSFAAPLVVTFAAAPACFFSTSTAPSQPIAQAAPGQPEMTDPQPSPPPPELQSPTYVVNKPPPAAQQPVQEAPTTSDAAAPAPDARRSWTLLASPGGGCATIETVACPDGVACNPPPPQPYDCLENVPLPSTITTFGNACVIRMPRAACPAGMHCNPPPPRRVPCPKA